MDLELLTYIERGFGSFHAGNIGSVSQRAAKLHSCPLNFENGLDPIGVKPEPSGSTRAGAGQQTFIRPPTLTASNFAAF